MNLEKLRKIGKRNSNSAWYKRFKSIYIKESPAAAAAWLKQQPEFLKVAEHTDYYPGKSGVAIKELPRYRYTGADGKLHNYHPDMLVTVGDKRSVIEIKSEWTLNLDIDKTSENLE